MAEIKFDITDINRYFEQNNIKIEKLDQDVINSIFDDCDVQNEQGQQIKDGILSGDEAKDFQDKLQKALDGILKIGENFVKLSANAFNSMRCFIDNLANINQSQEVKCILNEEEKETYRKNLQEAKALCNKNKEQLGLTDSEIEYINKAVVKSRNNNGAAEFDRESRTLIFNFNGRSDTSVGSLLKILIHEATHSTINKEQNSKSNERQCETRALTKTYELYKQGKINDFEIMTGSNIYISQLDTDIKISQFVEDWLHSDGYKNLPEN